MNSFEQPLLKQTFCIPENCASYEQGPTSCCDCLVPIQDEWNPIRIKHPAVNQNNPAFTNDRRNETGSPPYVTEKRHLSFLCELSYTVYNQLPNAARWNSQYGLWRFEDKAWEKKAVTKFLCDSSFQLITHFIPIQSWCKSVLWCSELWIAYHSSGLS